MSQDTGVVSNGIRMASEVLVSPGTSLLLNGNVSSGLTHVAGGLLSRAVLGCTLGPLAVAGIALNSYAKSSTGVGLIGHINSSLAARKAKNAVDEVEAVIEDTAADSKSGKK